MPILIDPRLPPTVPDLVRLFQSLPPLPSTQLERQFTSTVIAAGVATGEIVAFAQRPLTFTLRHGLYTPSYVAILRDGSISAWEVRRSATPTIRRRAANLAHDWPQVRVTVWTLEALWVAERVGW